MPPIDPHAPATSPRHPLNAARAAREEHEMLSSTHATDAERDADQVPTLTELRARRTLLIRHLEAVTSDADTEPPVITDQTGAEVALAVNEDGSEAAWEPLDDAGGGGEDGDGHHDPDGKPDPFANLTRRELRPLLIERELPVGGNRNQMIKRLYEFEAEKAAAEWAASSQ